MVGEVKKIFKKYRVNCLAEGFAYCVKACHLQWKALHESTSL